MAYTRADMEKIYRMGIVMGLGYAGSGEGSETIAADTVEQVLGALRKQKAEAQPNGTKFDAQKAIEAWIKAGRPKDSGLIFPEFFGG